MNITAKFAATGLLLLPLVLTAQNNCPKECQAPPVCFERGYPNTKCCFPAAYNEPAQYEVGCAWDYWIDASFTYWEALQEGMDLAVNTALSPSTSILFSPDGGNYLFQDTEYKPGFKVGLGVDFRRDGWIGFGEYTWFRSVTSTHRTPPADSRGAAVWSVNSWYVLSGDGTVPAGSTALSSLSSKWQLNMDLADVGVSRPCYQGTHLIVAPFGGVRGQWIRQSLDISGITADEGISGTADLFATCNIKSHSWAVGPRAGFNTKWHVRWGFRAEGALAASLLFTQYTQASSHLSATTTTSIPVSGRFPDLNCLRAVNEMNLGIGWGSYSNCRKYHIDFLATYDFQIFWNQNMMRAVANDLSVRTEGSVPNLYLQGLTIKAALDF